MMGFMWRKTVLRPTHMPSASESDVWCQWWISRKSWG